LRYFVSPVSRFRFFENPQGIETDRLIDGFRGRGTLSPLPVMEIGVIGKIGFTDGNIDPTDARERSKIGQPPISAS
jgi:hypothetical protein